MKLELKKSSWENLFKVIRKNNLKTEGNFWASIQYLENQVEELDLLSKE